MTEFFEFNSKRLAYSKEGQGNHRLIFLHGICGKRAVWEEQIRFFSKSFEVVAIDLLGHGESSDIPGKDFFQVNREILKRYLNHFPKSSTIIGHSLSGSLVNDLIGANRFLKQYVFVDSSCLAQEENLVSYRRLKEKILSQEQPKAFFNAWFSEFLSDRSSPAQRALIINEAVYRNPLWMGELMGSIQRSHKQSISEDKLLIIEGSQYFGAGNSMSWHQLYPTASRWSYPNAGHYYFWDDPRPFNAALESFLVSAFECE